MMEDGLSPSLRRAITKPKARESKNNAWILEAIWGIIDKRFYARWDPALDQTILQRLGRAINASLKSDWQQRMEEEGGAI